MENPLTKLCNRVLEYSFYALFLLVPLVFTSDNYELFEFNKMWLTFGITILIAGSWLIKMILQGKIFIQRTPLDIPIALFLFSQIVSTVFSLDPHVSLWGYYSRFNGGLLSVTAYIVLFYAFVTHSNALMTKRLLLIALSGGAIVALWGIPSHFGYDPTCFLFRGTLDVSCWTESFKPTVRIFSTLGQPNWLAAYLSILIPIAVAFALKQFQISNFKFQTSKTFLLSTFYFLLSILFYVALLFTDSLSGFAGLGSAMLFLLIGFLFFLPKEKKNLVPIIISANILFLVITLFFGGSLVERAKSTVLNVIFQKIDLQEASNKTSPSVSESSASNPPLGGTESWKIRMLYVWPGAFEIFKNNPLIGTGVETFAFSYYKHRPIGHNLTSEWDYLYNKAHNEYLNYLATTGILGLGSYLIMIITFIILILKRRRDNDLLATGLLASYISILVSNFFGFSVVIVNLYFFLIPAFVFVLLNLTDPKQSLSFSFPETIQVTSYKLHVTRFRWPLALAVLLLTFYLLFTLFRFWAADKAYALGYNLDRIGQYQIAYGKLQEAVFLRNNEPTFLDELSLNKAMLASMLFSVGQEATLAAQLRDEAIQLSNQLVADHPNNPVFWKTRVRAFYALGQTDAQYLTIAREAMEKIRVLSPTDAKVAYNLALLYGQTEEKDLAIETLKQTLKLKPDYKDAYYALGLFYHEASLDKQGRTVKPELQKKAVEAMRYILDNFATDDAQAKKALETWGEQ